MASLATSAFSLPKHLASGIWSKASTGSTVAALSGSEPMLFGETQLMTFTSSPKAQFVAEGAAKAGSDAGFGSKTVTPRKAQVTLRFNEEVQWADEDYQLGVLTKLSEEVSKALARALDLGIYHAINPLDGKALSGAPAKILDSANVVEMLDGSRSKRSRVGSSSSGSPNSPSLGLGPRRPPGKSKSARGNTPIPSSNSSRSFRTSEASCRRSESPSPGGYRVYPHPRVLRSRRPSGRLHVGVREPAVRTQPDFLASPTDLARMVPALLGSRLSSSP